jgi:hypothetical protein
MTPGQFVALVEAGLRCEGVEKDPDLCQRHIYKDGIHMIEEVPLCRARRACISDYQSICRRAWL